MSMARTRSRMLERSFGRVSNDVLLCLSVCSLGMGMLTVRLGQGGADKQP